MNPIEILVEYWPRLLDGTLMTLKLTFLGALIAGLVAPGFALIRVYASPLAQSPLRLYISFMRGTPILAQLFLVFYGSTAYQTEILRGGIQGVPRGEIEAARAVGMGPITLLRRVIFPHAYRIAWPALGNEVILLMKASALASVITVFDLLGRTRQIFSRTFDFSTYLWAALIYLCITAAFVLLWRLVERRLSRHIHARAATASIIKEIRT